MIQEFVSKVQFPRPFLKKKRFFCRFLGLAIKNVFLKSACRIELLKPFSELSHQTGSFGLSQYIGILFSLKVPSCAFWPGIFFFLLKFRTPLEGQTILTKLYYYHSVNNVSHVNIVNHFNSVNHVNSVNNVNSENHANIETHVNSESSIWCGASSISDVFLIEDLNIVLIWSGYVWV